MRPPLRIVPLDTPPMTAAEIIEVGLAWLEYGCELLRKDPNPPNILEELWQLKEAIRYLQELEERGLRITECPACHSAMDVLVSH